MGPRVTVAVALAALAAGLATLPVIVSSDHLDTKVAWSIFAPALGWSWIGTGIYADRRRPESRVGVLMVLFGFAWLLSAAMLLSDAPLPYTFGGLAAGVWVALFLQLIMTFPSGRIEEARDRGIIVAAWVIFPLGSVPARLVGNPDDLGCADCPTSVLLIDRNETLATIALAGQAVLYLALYAVVLVRLTRRWRRRSRLDRLELTPVYASGLLTFLLLIAGQAGAGNPAWAAAMIAAAALPFAFLTGLVRHHVARLDVELRVRLQDLRTSRQRLVEAGDTERRRLERNLHDGAQSRLVAVALLLGQARDRLERDSPLAPTLDRAIGELKTSLAELRELARGLHPAILTDRGLEPAVQALAARAPVPTTVDVEDDGQRLPAAVETAAYYVISEALANVAKYAQATSVTVTLRRAGGRLAIEVADDGVGGADAAAGSGLRGLADRLDALEGTIALDSPPGEGTRLRAEIPYTDILAVARAEGRDRTEPISKPLPFQARQH